MFARDVLAFLRIEVIQIGSGDRFGASLPGDVVHQSHRRLRQDTERRRDDLEFLRAEFLQRQVGLVFPGDKDVSDLALDKGDGRATRAGVEHRDILEESGQELARLGIVVAVFLQRIRPGCQVVPTSTARGFRIRGDDGNAGLDEVVPVSDALRIPLAHQEHDSRGVGGAVVGETLLPIRRQQPRFVGYGVNVVGERERDHIGLEAVNHRARLLARAAVRLADGDFLAGLALPGLGKRGVHVLVSPVCSFQCLAKAALNSP